MHSKVRPAPSASHRPLYSASALRQKLHTLPCSASSRRIRFAGFRREALQIREGPLLSEWACPFWVYALGSWYLAMSCSRLAMKFPASLMSWR